MLHSQLNHDCVVKLHEYTESDDQFVLFMEYCNDAEYFDNKIVEVSYFTDFNQKNMAEKRLERKTDTAKCPVKEGAIYFLFFLVLNLSSIMEN